MATHTVLQPDATAVARQGLGGLIRAIAQLGTIVSRSLAGLAEQRVPTVGGPARYYGEDLSARMSHTREPQRIGARPSQPNGTARTASHTSGVPAATRVS